MIRPFLLPAVLASSAQAAEPQNFLFMGAGDAAIHRLRGELSRSEHHLLEHVRSLAEAITDDVASTAFPVVARERLKSQRTPRR